MKNRHLGLVLTILLSIPASLHGQAWSGILSTARAMDWSGNGATITNRTTQCGSTIAAYSGSASTISSALASCPAGDYVQLGAGTFTLSSSLVTTQSNVTLRGMGANQTFLVFTAVSSNCNGVGGTSICIWNGDSSSFQFSGNGNLANWTAGYSQGTTQLTLSSTTNLKVGMNVILTQNDDSSDPGNIYICQTSGTTGACSQQGGQGVAKAGAAESQNVTVTAISGNTVTISPGIYAPNWTSAKSPTAWWSNYSPISGFGLENLSVDYSNLGEEENGIEFHLAKNCWVKNVRSVNNTASGGATHKHVNIYDSNHITVRDSYFYGASPTSEGYGVDNGPASANDLTENNIFQHLPTGTINESSCCDVIGYNYAVDDYYNNGAPNWQQQNEFHHGAGDYYILWEGNEGIGFDADDIHGTSFFLTHFRDYLSGHDTATEVGSKNQASFAYFPFANNRYDNVVGSVLGTASYHTFYQNLPNSTTDCSGSSGNSSLSVFVLGFSDQGGTGFSSACVGAGFTIYNDTLVASTLVRWGNYAACTGDANCNAVRWQSSETASAAPVYPGLASPSQTLPASFYHSSQPAFWGSMPWPAVGPDVSSGNISNGGGHANHNPAANCYLNVMGGQTNGSSGALTYNASSCYNATAVNPLPPSNVVATPH